MFSVIVATYNAPRELDFAFCGLSRQTKPPGEILVADDGSSEETSDLISCWRQGLGCRLIHVWHTDQGYQKSRIVNEAVRRSRGDQLLFLDGDSIPHSQWVSDHMQAADERHVLCGRRVKLGPEISRQLTRKQILDGELESLSGWVMKSALKGDTKRFLLGVRLSPWFARLLHPRPRKLMGVNYSLPRKAFEAVNGYDEEWNVYGHEDRDLELRLIRSSFPFYPVLNRAVVYHLYHTLRPISERTKALIKEQETSDRKRCEQGLFRMVS